MNDPIDNGRLDLHQCLQILEATAEFLVVVDQNGACTYVNDRTAKNFGYPMNGIVGRRFFDVLPEPSRSEWRSHVDTVFKTIAPKQFHDKGFSADIVIHPLMGEDGVSNAVFFSRTPVRFPVDRQAERSERGESLYSGGTEAVLRAVVDNSPSGINLKDTSGRFLLVNAEFQRWHGGSADGTECRDVYDFYEKEVADRITEIDRQVVATGKPYAFELEVPRIDGGILTAWVQKFPVFDDSGSPIAVGAVTTDISVRKRMEQSIRESEARFRAVFEESSIGMATVSPEGHYLSVNSAFLSMLGYTEDELTGMHFSQITHPDDIEYGMDHHRRYQSGEPVPTVFEKRYVRKDGSVLWASVTVSSVRDLDGNEVFGIRQFQDISERKDTEEWMRTLSLAIEQYPGGIWITDADYRFEYVNPAFRKETGYTLGEFVGRSPAILDPEGADSKLIQEISTCLERQESLRGEFWHRRKDGSKYLADVQVRPIVDPDGQIKHFVGFSENITERREIAERLRQSEKMEVIGQLTGGVAHDFNNILAVILTNAEILEATFDNADDRRISVSAISRASLRAAKLTERLLAFSRRQALHPERIDLRVVVGDMVDILRRTLGETITVGTSLDEDIPLVWVDVGQMENAILNLAVNARDAMPNGGELTLGLDVQTTEINGRPPASFVRFTVADTGCGMAEEVRERIFEPFFTTKARGAGTGLGLSMVYGFVNQSGGDIRVESTVGKGTIFHILLPALGYENGSGRKKEDVRRDPLWIPPITIVLVEDDAAVRGSGRRILEAMGATVIEAEDAQRGLEALARTDGVDLLFTDIVMPGGFDGRWLAEKAQMLLPGLRVLFTSGYAEGRIDEADVDHRTTEFIAKPFTREQLALAIRRLFGL